MTVTNPHPPHAAPSPTTQPTTNHRSNALPRFRPLFSPDGHRVTTPRDPTASAWELEDAICWHCAKRMPGNLGIQVFVPSVSSKHVSHLVIVHPACHQ